MSIHTVVKNLSQTLNAEEGDTSKAEVLLASAIAICLPVPGESNGANGRTYFNTNHLDYVKRIINAVNEEFMIDVTKASKLVADIYAFRYNTVHEANATLDAFKSLVEYAYKGVSENETTFPDVSSSELKSVVTALCGLDE